MVSDCPICHEVISDTNCVTYPCHKTHKFHLSCVISNNEQNGSIDVCMMCRQNVNRLINKKNGKKNIIYAFTVFAFVCYIYCSHMSVKGFNNCLNIKFNIRFDEKELAKIDSRLNKCSHNTAFEQIMLHNQKNHLEHSINRNKKLLQQYVDESNMYMCDKPWTYNIDSIFFRRINIFNFNFSAYYIIYVYLKIYGNYNIILWYPKWFIALLMTNY